MARPSEQVCLPKPLYVRARGARRSPLPLKLEFVREACPRTAQLAARWLPQIGELRVDIEQVESTLPGLDMNERYQLESQDDGVLLRSTTSWGALRGLATLWQLSTDGLPEDVQVEDQPAYPWRGLLIDVARHFLPLENLYAVLDGMARLKLNVLHLHLSDDQAVRFPSEAFPQLASAEHYAKHQLIELVAAAADLGIRVVPELDVPGHTTAWLAACPQWGTAPAEATRRFGVHRACLNVADEEVVQAVEQIFDELLAVFGDTHVHIGGDEVHGQAWEQAPGMQAHLRRHNLTTEDVQNHFNHRLVAFLRDRGRTAVGWDEVLHDDMPHMLVQNWRGATSRDRALALGQPCIVSAPYYLDLFFPADMHYLSPALAQADWLQWEDALPLDPRLVHVADGIGWTRQWRAGAQTVQPQSQAILGGEACLWSELVDAETLPVRLWSRLPAVAEALWSQELDTLQGFYPRLEHLLQLEPFAVRARADSALARLGLDEAQRVVAHMFEPAKWYTRLLGAEALEARIAGREMPQARPYDADTELCRVVDFLPPESHDARALVHADEDTWRAYAQVWRKLDATTWPADMQGAVAALAEFAGVLLDSDVHPDHAMLARFNTPFGTPREYMLAPVASFLQRKAP